MKSGRFSVVKFFVPTRIFWLRGRHKQFLSRRSRFCDQNRCGQLLLQCFRESPKGRRISQLGTTGVIENNRRYLPLAVAPSLVCFDSSRATTAFSEFFKYRYSLHVADALASGAACVLVKFKANPLEATTLAFPRLLFRSSSTGRISTI